MGGFVGSVLRYTLSTAFSSLTIFSIPTGTFFVNILGSFAMGYAAGTFLKYPIEEPLRLMVTYGILGGFTTFSAFSLEFFELSSKGQFSQAIIYMIASFVLGVVFLALGYKIS
jgi:fluoride exporter